MRGALAKVLVVSLFLGQTCLAAQWDKKKASFDSFDREQGYGAPSSS
jgi:hypothetical protein